MKFLSLKPFVPSGPNFEMARDFFVELGFHLAWDMGNYAGFENNGCGFIPDRKTTPLDQPHVKSPLATRH